MELINLFKNEKEVKSYSAGDKIFEEGDKGDYMYVVLDGYVDLDVRGKLVETVGPGSFFGEMALIDAQGRSATATAKTDCRLVPISEKRLEFMVQQTPYFSLHMMRVIVQRIRKMNAML